STKAFPGDVPIGTMSAVPTGSSSVVHVSAGEDLNPHDSAAAAPAAVPSRSAAARENDPAAAPAGIIPLSPSPGTKAAVRSHQRGRAPRWVESARFGFHPPDIASTSAGSAMLCP